MIEKDACVDKYILRERLGKGAFGVVYLARDVALQTDCAVKFVEIDHPSQAPLVLQEAQSLHRCAGQHIVKVNSADLITDDGSLYAAIDMEYLPEGSISARLRASGINIADAITASRHALLGLASAHHSGIIHRDVKPANILIDGSMFKLTDFGISHIKATASGKSELYQPHAAPECLKGQPTTERSDIYAAALTLYRLCELNGTGKLSKAKLSAWAATGMQTGFPEFAGLQAYLPRRLKSIILKGSNVDPAQRYASAEEMISAIEALRVTNAWRKDGVGKWRTDASRPTTLEMIKDSKGTNLIYKVAGRRRTAMCHFGLTDAQASKTMHKIVADTMLQ